MSLSFTQMTRAAATEPRLAVPDSWLQGRTAYGGLVAALALSAARRAAPDLPPLRTAQIAFLGPTAGELAFEAGVLRAGRSMTFVGVDARGGAGLAARCLFGFGAARESAVDSDDVPMPDVPGPDELPALASSPDHPAFLGHFDVRVALGAPPFSGAEEAQSLWWVRHRDEAARAGETSLVGLGDVLPPAVLSMLAAPAPAASVTWQLDLLTDAHDSQGGWYLLGVAGEGAVQGYAAQAHMAWARDGEPVMAGRQGVAVFG